MSVVAAKGFRAAGVDAGIKKGESLDLTLVVSDHEAAAAGTFTQNRAAAAPVRLDRRHLADKLERAGYLSERRFVESLIRRRASRGSRLIELELRESR